MQARAGLYTRGGRYEGPTGITGVLTATMRDLDVQAASVWANVPHYVSASPNPPATLALLKAVTAMLEAEVPLGRMGPRVGGVRGTAHRGNLEELGGLRIRPHARGEGGR